MGELLNTVISVYIITMLIKISAKFESYYNILAVFRYISTISPASFNMQVYTRFKQYVAHIACSYLHCSKLFEDMECILLPTIYNYYC